MWCVVVFTKENTIAVVPSKWYIKETEKCYWPPSQHIKKKDFEERVISCSNPEETWTTYPAKALKEFDDYEIAKKKLMKARERETLSTTDDDQEMFKKRKREVPKKYQLSPSESERDSEASIDESDEELNPIFPLFPISHSEKDVYKKNKGDTTISEDKTKKKKNSQKTVSTRKSTFFRTRSNSWSNDNRPLTVNDKLNNISQPNQELLETMQQMSRRQDRYQVEVLRSLNIINEKVNNMQSKIDLKITETQNRVEEDATEVETSELLTKLPIVNETVLNEIEEQIKEGSILNLLVKSLSRIGGVDLSDVVKNIMNKLLTNEVGQKFNWEGTKGKMKFKKLKLKDVIFNTVRRHIHTREVTDSDIIVEIKKWLVKCKSRCLKEINQQNVATNLP